MQNLMIADNDISNIKEIINNISKSVINVNIYNVSTNRDEVINFINTKDIDILLINIKIFEEEIVRFVESNISNLNEKSIILFSKDSKYIKTFHKYIKNNKYIFKYIDISKDLIILVNSLQKIVYIKEKHIEENEIKRKIERELKKINYNFEHIGTRYLLESIYIIYESKEYSINLNKNVYSVLSKKYNKSINTIKGDITQATKMMYYECDEKRIKSYFGYLDETVKPTVKEVITTINDRI